MVDSLAMRPFVLGALLCLTAAPVRGESDPGASRMLRQLDSREALQDSLESFFDSRVCTPLKQGRFTLPGDVAAPEVRLPTDPFVWISGCSVRALAFEPRPEGTTARLLLELDGVDREGARRSVRGEASATLSQPRRAAWRLEQVELAWRQEAVRPEPRFLEEAERAGLVLPPEADGEAAGIQASMSNGALAVRDFDGDGLVDVLVADPRALYLFRATAPLRYVRTRLAVSPPKGAWFSSLAAGDFDADGDPDVIVTTQTAWNAESRPAALRNDGKGRFTVVASRLPPANSHASLATDFDADGKLDLVFLHYPMKYGPDDFLAAKDGRPARFFRGKGDLTFQEVAPPRDERHRRWGLAAVAADLLGEGRPQVYVANDFGDNDLWRFDAQGTPRDVTDAHHLRDPGNGMSADVGDVNGDGRLDLYVANMFSKAGTRVLAAARVRPELKARLDKFAAGNTLYLSREDGGFDEVARARGVNRGLWAFGSIFLDADDDGRLDLAVANGYYSAPNRKDL
ncbi:FG-GAP repeat domain-containing protein [Archangium gephyra]|uniref:FG-GAP repeat domain-containing protein n=1 Tax=Archangium gephyra TaxID=48 RepID=UPI003B81767F